MDNKFKAEKMFYQPNGFSYKLVFLAILANTVFIVFTNTAIKPTMDIGISILFNVVYLMFLFFLSEQLKVYSKKWAIVSMIVALFQIYRFVDTPIAYSDQLENSRFMLLSAMLLVQLIALGLAGYTTHQKANLIDEYLPEEERYK